MPDRRPLLLGEAPSRSGDRYWVAPLSGLVGQRLCEFAGVDPLPEGTRYGRYYWALRERFEPRNLLERYPGPQGRGAALPPALARPAMQALLPDLDDRVVVLLGSRLAQLFGVVSGGWTHVQVIESTRSSFWAATIPHPSGLNRVYNDPAERERAGAVLREALRRASSLEALDA